MQDANTIESYNIEEKGFIVCMVSKVCVDCTACSRRLSNRDLFAQPKTAPSAAASTSQAPSTPARAAASTPAAPQAPAPSTSAAPAPVPATPSPAGAAGAAATAAAPFNDPSALAMGAQGESVISQMEAMGFPRPEIERAMRAAFYNPDRAIDYLLNVSETML